MPFFQHDLLLSLPAPKGGLNPYYTLLPAFYYYSAVCGKGGVILRAPGIRPRPVSIYIALPLHDKIVHCRENTEPGRIGGRPDLRPDKEGVIFLLAVLHLDLEGDLP